MKRRIILEVAIPGDHSERILMVCADLCDKMEQYVEANLIDGYGVGIEVDQVVIRGLPTHSQKEVLEAEE